MQITFLGTGTSQGIPVIGCTDKVCLSKDKFDKRLRSSILMAWDHFKYVIDCGPDFRQQMLTENIANINGILFTHYHADHTAGLDDIRPFSFINGNVPFYADKKVIENLKERFNYIFATKNRYLGAPSVSLNEIENQPFQLENKMVIPIEINHGNMMIFGYRVDDFAYITDAKTVANKEKGKLKNLDALVVNSLRIDEHPTHFSLQQALDFIEEVNPKRAYLTHISHKLGLHAEVSKTLPKNVFLAYDGLKISI